MIWISISCYRFLANLYLLAFFLLFKTSSATFLLANLTIVFVVLPSLWQATIFLQRFISSLILRIHKCSK